MAFFRDRDSSGYGLPISLRNARRADGSVETKRNYAVLGDRGSL